MPGEWCATTCNKRYPSEVSENSIEVSIDRTSQRGISSVDFRAAILRLLSQVHIILIETPEGRHVEARLYSGNSADDCHRRCRTFLVSQRMLQRQ